MCTIAILIEVVADAPLVIAANRDELHARPTRGPTVLRESPRIAGGLDVASGGTWLAVRRDGHFAAVTNQRALATPPPGLVSRGQAVIELAAARDPDGYAATLDPAAYASMNLVWRSGSGVAIAYARREERSLEIAMLGPGIHVLCNDRVGAPGFPRAERLRVALEHATHARPPWRAVVDPIATALADHQRVALADTPPSHLPPELARELTATCIHTEHYGTRSATLLALAPDRVLGYLHAEGPPCTASFVDRRELLDA
jgi:uncharacterized protein with NRDE domain